MTTITIEQSSDVSRDSVIDVSILVAIRNEVEHIDRCINSLVNQDFPKDKYEIVIADAMSVDGTREIVKSYEKKFPQLIKVLDNPNITQAYGRITALNHAKGRIIMYLDGHSYVSTRHISTLVKALDNSAEHVVAVGTNLRTPDDETFMGKVIAEVQKTLIGGGTTSMRVEHEQKNLDTVAFPAYKRDVLDFVGFYDPRFVIGEDVELNLRINKRGFKIMICPEIFTSYYRKYDSITRFAKKMLNYGIWRAIVVKKHPDSIKPALILPSLLVAFFCTFPFILLFNISLLTPYIAFSSLYLLALFVSSIIISNRQQDARYLISFVIYLVEHTVFGFGFIRGLFKKLCTNR